MFFDRKIVDVLAPVQVRDCELGREDVLPLAWACPLRVALLEGCHGPGGGTDEPDQGLPQLKKARAHTSMRSDSPMRLPYEPESRGPALGGMRMPPFSP